MLIEGKYIIWSLLIYSTFSITNSLIKNLTISALKSLAIAQAMTMFFALICSNFLTWTKRTYLNPKGIFLLLSNVILFSFSYAQSDLNQKIQDAAPQNFFEKQKVMNGFGGNGGQGRVNCIKIHPNNENIIYIGAPNRGIWKTTDGGRNNPNRVFAITGDGDPLPRPFMSKTNLDSFRSELFLLSEASIF